MDIKLAVGADEGLGEIPSLGSYADTSAAFLAKCGTWLSKQDTAVRRVAHGVVALIPVASHVAGYERLQGFLPAVKMSSSSSDFLYQVNRPRPSVIVNGLKINRLSRWGVAKLQYARFAVDPNMRLAPAVLGDPSYACRSELDVNSMAEFAGAFDAQVLTHLVDELRGLSAELLEVGDVP